MKKNSLFFSAVLLLASCSGESTAKSNGQVVSSIEAGGANDAAFNEEIADLEAQSRIEEAKQREMVTTLKFDKEVHDFGEIAAGSDNSCVFTVTNTGTKPLTIFKVGASCGCTTPKKPEKPIPPGKSDVIEVGFKPTGTGPTEKTITIQANTDPRISVVKVKANLK